jgi:hypothetical protein
MHEQLGTLQRLLAAADPELCLRLRAAEVTPDMYAVRGITAGVAGRGAIEQRGWSERLRRRTRYERVVRIARVSGGGSGRRGWD